MSRYPAEPGSRVILPFYAPQLCMQLEKNLLRHILCCRCVSQKIAGDAEHHCLVLPQQPLKIERTAMGARLRLAYGAKHC